MTERKHQSLAEAVEFYYEELCRYVRRKTGSASLAEDIVQDTWLRASTRAAAMPENPRAYLYRMAGNLAIDHLRRREARAFEVADPERYTRIASDAPTPENEVAAREELAILEAAVRELPARRRQVFVLYRGHGMTMREIADRLGISQKTVEKQIARAMVHCRKRMRESGRGI